MASKILLTSCKDYYLFDFDGTIADPEMGIARSAQYALSKFGIEIEDLNEFKPFIGPPLYDTFTQFYKFSVEDANLAINYFREYFEEKGMYEYTLYPGIEEMLASLKEKGKDLAIVTSKPTVYAKKLSAHFKIERYFDHVIGSNLDNTRTDKFELITECIKSFDDFDKKDYVMLGDREYDILGAKKVGIESIGCLYGYSLKDELLKAGADYLVKKPLDIVGLQCNLKCT